MKDLFRKLETGLEKQRSAAQETCVCCKKNEGINLNTESHG
jgi:hypothetical protein